MKSLNWLSAGLLIALSIPACAQTGLPASLLRQVPVSFKLPSAAYTLAANWQAAGGPQSHIIGKAVADAQASHGKAWQVAKGDTPFQDALFGPYAQIAPGEYIAFYRIKPMGTSDMPQLAELDAATDYGSNPLNSETITLSQVPPGRYSEIPLAFSYQGGKLEVRLSWPGYTPLRIDNVLLYRLTGAASFPLSNRAPQPTESNSPSSLRPTLIHMRYDDLFPRSNPPAATLQVLDMRQVGPEKRLLLLSLEGLVNRKQPRIYSIFDPTDIQWLHWMVKKKWIRGYRICSPAALLKQYAGSYHGAVVFDPNLPATINTATMLASVKNALVAGPQLAHQMHLTVVADLRHRWHTSVQATLWAWQTLWPKLSHRVIACTAPDQLNLRDYLVEKKVFLFWLSGPLDGVQPGSNPQAELNLMEKLLGKMPANIPVISYPYDGKDVGIGEGPGVTLFAEYGKYLVGSTNCPNLSVHSGIRVAPFHQAHPAPPPLQYNKIYVAWIMSDGDNLPVLTNGNFPQFWQNPLRGTIPIGWSVSPSAALLIPDIVSYYYQTATPLDQFVGAVSGVGYTYPDYYGTRFRSSYREEVWKGFLNQTRLGYQRMDLQDAWLMNITRRKLFNDFVTAIPTLKALFPDYGAARLTTYKNTTYPVRRNVPVFHAVTSWQENASPAQQVDSLVQQIRSITPNTTPAFLHLFALNWFTRLSILRQVMQKLGKEYVAVRPDQLTALYSQYLRLHRLFTHLPHRLYAIAKQPLSFSLWAQNTTQSAHRLRLSVSLAGKTLHYSKILQSGQRYKLTVRLPHTPSTVTTKMQIAGAERISQLIVTVIHPGSILGGAAALPHGEVTHVTHIWAVTLPHRAGAEVFDVQAFHRHAWSSPDSTASPSAGSYLIYGPYQRFTPGKYVALFRIERTGIGTGSAATLDVASQGGTHILQKLTLSANQLPAGKYIEVPLTFTTHGAPLETRLFWFGSVPLRIDSIDLFKVEKEK